MLAAFARHGPPARPSAHAVVVMKEDPEEPSTGQIRLSVEGMSYDHCEATVGRAPTRADINGRRCSTVGLPSSGFTAQRAAAELEADRHRWKVATSRRPNRRQTQQVKPPTC